MVSACWAVARAVQMDTLVETELLSLTVQTLTGNRKRTWDRPGVDMHACRASEPSVQQGEWAGSSPAPAI